MYERANHNPFRPTLQDNVVGAVANLRSLPQLLHGLVCNGPIRITCDEFGVRMDHAIIHTCRTKDILSRESKIEDVDHGAISRSGCVGAHPPHICLWLPLVTHAGLYPESQVRFSQVL